MKTNRTKTERSKVVDYSSTAHSERVIAAWLLVVMITFMGFVIPYWGFRLHLAISLLIMVAVFGIFFGGTVKSKPNERMSLTFFSNFIGIDVIGGPWPRPWWTGVVGPFPFTVRRPKAGTSYVFSTREPRSGGYARGHEGCTRKCKGVSSGAHDFEDIELKLSYTIDSLIDNIAMLASQEGGLGKPGETCEEVADIEFKKGLDLLSDINYQGDFISDWVCTNVENDIATGWMHIAEAVPTILARYYGTGLSTLRIRQQVIKNVLRLEHRGIIIVAAHTQGNPTRTSEIQQRASDIHTAGRRRHDAISELAQEKFDTAKLNGQPISWKEAQAMAADDLDMNSGQKEKREHLITGNKSDDASILLNS